MTFRSGQYSSQIDYILARREDRRDCLASKVFPGECVVPQHKLVVADFRLRVRVHRDKHVKIARTKWWKLRGEAAQTFKERMLGEGPWEEGEDADDMWLKMATCVRKVASEVFGVREANRRGKTPSGGTTRCKRLLRRRRSVSSASTLTRVQPTSRAIN